MMHIESEGQVFESRDFLLMNDMYRTRIEHKHRCGDGLPKMITEPSPRFLNPKIIFIFAATKCEAYSPTAKQI